MVVGISHHMTGHANIVLHLFPDKQVLCWIGGSCKGFCYQPLAGGEKNPMTKPCVEDRQVILDIYGPVTSRP